MFKKIITTTVFISVFFLVEATYVYAGSLTPPGAPTNTMYTLTDIFNLSTGATTTLGSGAIPSTPVSVTASFKTLTEVYDAIVTQIGSLSNAKIARGITAFGFTGTLFGDTNASKVLSTAIYPGTIPVKIADNAVTGGTVSGTSILLTPPTGYYDGIATVSTTSDVFISSNIKSGVDIFGVTGSYTSLDTSDATAAISDILLSKTAYVNGSKITGTIPVKIADNAVTGGTVSGTSILLTPPTGYYDGIATVSTTSDVFISSNIKSGVDIFGVTGSYTSLDTSDATAAISDILLSKTAYVNGSKITGTMSTQTLSSANDTVSAGHYAATTLSAIDTDLVVSNIKSGVNIFGKVGTALSAQLIRTNQTICYNLTGAVIGCTGTGQDGELQKGAVRSFTDNGDGTITDNNSGLIWQKQDSGSTYTNANAFAYCNANTAALPGSSWRLPNAYELYSILDFGVASAPFINGTYFPATQSANYLSSTSYPSGKGSSIVVSFSIGNAASLAKAGSTYVRCVR